MRQNPALHYNAIPLLHEQTQVSEATLECLAKIFVRHGAHLSFSAVLLHRHLRLGPHEVMVSRYSGRQSVSSIRADLRTLSEDIYPCATFVNPQGGLEPFEFSTTQTKPNPEFFREVSDYLFREKLHGLLAFAQWSPSAQPWVEYLLGHETGTISTPLARADFAQHPGITTEWAFESRHGGIKILPWKKCVEMESGGHKNVAG